jgi:DNA-binding Xre family transcriptional regulator
MKRLSGVKLKKIRELRRLNKNQLAKSIGVQFKDIANYEKDATRFPKMESVKKLAKALECHPNDLLEDGTYKLKPCVVCGKLINPDRGRKACGDMHIKGTCAYKRHQANMKKHQERTKTNNNVGRPKGVSYTVTPKQLTCVEVPNYADETVSMQMVEDCGIIRVHAETNQGGVYEGDLPMLSAKDLKQSKREYNGYYDCTTHI